jgi:hypothetical protein
MLEIKPVPFNGAVHAMNRNPINVGNALSVKSFCPGPYND